MSISKKRFTKSDLQKLMLLNEIIPLPYGSDSTKYLKELLKEGEVDADIFGTDRYGRKLGRLYWKGMDINRKLVSAGYAWVYDKYVTDNSFYRKPINS